MRGAAKHFVFEGRQVLGAGVDRGHVCDGGVARRALAVAGRQDGDGDGREIHTLDNRAATALREVYIRRVMDTVNDPDNVLYEIGNECGLYSTAMV